MGGISEKAARPLICEKNPEVKARAISTTQKKIRPSFLVPPRFRDRGRKPDNCQLPEPEPEPEPEPVHPSSFLRGRRIRRMRVVQ